MLTEFDVLPINLIWKDSNALIDLIRTVKMESGSDWSFEKRPLDLKSLYFPAPPKGGAHLPRFAVWQPKNRDFGSVMVSNYEDGLIQLMRHLNKRFAVSYFSALIARDYRKRGFCNFEYRGELGATRVVYVIRDPTWKFFENGERLYFENPAYYETKKIADRMTPAILVEYLKSLHWNVESASFWTSDEDAWFGQQLRWKTSHSSK
jgi:hypothetical protein